MKDLLLVGLGGFAGSVCRYGVGISAARFFHGNFPFGTLIVNIVGSLIIGILAGYFLKNQSQHAMSLFLITGFCGGFTTFSTFSFDNLKLIKEGMISTFALYGLGSILFGIIFCAAGFWLTYKS